ncbi:MAG: protein BatD [Bacteroidales bacterium]|nr:protein BatD [Bacteroidales bacterium]
MIHRIFLLTILSLIGMTVSLSVSAQKVELRVDMPRGQRSIGVGDEFHITYQVSDISAAPEQPRNVPGAKLLYFDRTGQSSRFQSINGRTSQSVSYTYTATLRATKEGNYSFGPISVGGVKSNAVSYTVGKAAATAASAAPSGARQSRPGQDADPNAPKFIGKGDGHLFLKASVSKSSAYEQEALVYTVKLYTTYSAIKFIGATSAPKFEGFVIEESKTRDTQFNYESVGGKTYATAVIARYIIFPQMAGNLKVIGNTYTVSVDQREYYDDPFWGNISYSTPLQLNVTPNDLTVNVRPLPSPRPADFSGGVGDFRIYVDTPSTNLKSNQAASVVYTVTGSGNIRYVHLPDLNALYPKELEVYSPTTDVNVSVGASNVTGTVKFDYSFLPLETGEYSVPEVALVYFNPSTGKYERSVARGFKVNVDKGAASEKSQTRSRLVFDNNLMPYSSPLSKSYTPYVRRFSYWLFFIIPALLFAGVVIWRSRYIKTHADMASLRSRRASKVARKRLRRASECLSRGESAKFYDEMLKALWGYIADRLKMPGSELTRDKVRAELERRGSDSTEAKRLLALVDECEFAKYAPGAEMSENMTKLYDSAFSVIDGIENSIGGSDTGGAEETSGTDRFRTDLDR